MKLINKTCYCCHKKKMIIANDDVCKVCVFWVNYMNETNGLYDFSIHRMIQQAFLDVKKERIANEG